MISLITSMNQKNIKFTIMSLSNLDKRCHFVPFLFYNYCKGKTNRKNITYVIE